MSKRVFDEEVSSHGEKCRQHARLADSTRDNLGVDHAAARPRGVDLFAYAAFGSVSAPAILRASHSPTP